MLRAAGVSIAVLALGFVITMVVAAARYPGGTWCQPHAPGYDLWRSFFCDVLHSRALNGTPNPGAPAARAAIVLIAAAFLPFWLAVPSTLELTRARARLVRIVGTASAVACLAVALTPSDRFPEWHQAAVLSGAGAGVLAALIAVSSRQLPLSQSSSALRWLAWAALLAAALDAALYAAQLASPAPCATALPALQKFAAALVLAWMLGTAWVLVAPRRRPAA